MTHQEILDAIKSMTLLEIKELVDAMKEEFGVTGAIAVAGGAAPAAAAAAEEEKTEFDVILKGCRLREDQGHQGCARSRCRPGPEGSQGNRGVRSQDHQGRRFQGRSREDRRAVQGCGRHRRNQVISYSVFKRVRKGSLFLFVFLLYHIHQVIYNSYGTSPHPPASYKCKSIYTPWRSL